MKGRMGIALALVVILSFAAGNAALYFSGRSLAARLKDRSAEVARMQSEVARLTEEKAGVLREKEKLSSDLVSHLAVLNRVEQEKSGLKTELDSAQKKIESNKTLLVQLKERLQAAEEKARQETVEREAVKSKRKVFGESSVAGTSPEAVTGHLPPLLEGTGAEEQGLYYYNLGVYYTRKDLFESAISAYERSLSFQPDSPQTCYNLALLYWLKREDRPKAISHFEKYLQLAPQSDDRNEVMGWLRQLRGTQ